MTLHAPKGIAPTGRWLSPMREPWPRAVCRLLEQGESAVVRVLIAEVRGSAPREAGTSMLVVRNGTFGTVGGGNLEWQATRVARSLIASGVATPSIQIWRLVLAQELAQCCGGVVQLWLERFTADDLPFLRRAALEWSADAAILTEVSGESVVRKIVHRGALDAPLRFTFMGDTQATLLEAPQARRAVLWVYGAGHVAQGLIHVLAELPFQVTWVDSRAELLPASLPDNVYPLCTQTPVDTISAAPGGALFLVMTHDHSLDYVLCRRILERQDFAWLGLIGSKSKGARFRARLARDEVPHEAITRMSCPIGIEGVSSKLPAAIAVAVAAQLLRDLEPVSSADAEAAAARGAAAGGGAVGTTARARPGVRRVGTGAVGAGAAGAGAVGTGAVGTGAVGTGAVGTGAVGTDVGSSADVSQVDDSCTGDCDACKAGAGKLPSP